MPILEHALLDVKPGQEAAFEAAMRNAIPLISAADGFLSLEVRPCVEDQGRYLLLVRWRSLEDHTQGFRGSPRYQEWKRLLHGFYDPFPIVRHFAEPIADA